MTSKPVISTANPVRVIAKSFPDAGSTPAASFLGNTYNKTEKENQNHLIPLFLIHITYFL
jgi:hypothetical protein